MKPCEQCKKVKLVSIDEQQSEEPSNHNIPSQSSQTENVGDNFHKKIEKTSQESCTEAENASKDTGIIVDSAREIGGCQQCEMSPQRDLAKIECSLKSLYCYMKGLRNTHGIPLEYPQYFSILRRVQDIRDSVRDYKYGLQGNLKCDHYANPCKCSDYTCACQRKYKPKSKNSAKDLCGDCETKPSRTSRPSRPSGKYSSREIAKRELDDMCQGEKCKRHTEVSQSSSGVGNVGCCGFGSKKSSPGGSKPYAKKAKGPENVDECPEIEPEIENNSRGNTKTKIKSKGTLYNKKGMDKKRSSSSGESEYACKCEKNSDHASFVGSNKDLYELEIFRDGKSERAICQTIRSKQISRRSSGSDSFECNLLRNSSGRQERKYAKNTKSSCSSIESSGYMPCMCYMNAASEYEKKPYTYSRNSSSKEKRPKRSGYGSSSYKELKGRPNKNTSNKKVQCSSFDSCQYCKKCRGSRCRSGSDSVTQSCEVCNEIKCKCEKKTKSTFSPSSIFKNFTALRGESPSRESGKKPYTCSRCSDAKDCSGPCPGSGESPSSETRKGEKKPYTGSRCSDAKDCSGPGKSPSSEIIRKSGKKSCTYSRSSDAKDCSGPCPGSGENLSSEIKYTSEKKTSTGSRGLSSKDFRSPYKQPSSEQKCSHSRSSSFKDCSTQCPCSGEIPSFEITEKRKAYRCSNYKSSKRPAYLTRYKCGPSCTCIADCQDFQIHCPSKKPRCKSGENIQVQWNAKSKKKEKKKKNQKSGTSEKPCETCNKCGFKTDKCNCKYEEFKKALPEIKVREASSILLNKLANHENKDFCKGAFGQNVPKIERNLAQELKRMKGHQHGTVFLKISAIGEDLYHIQMATVKKSCLGCLYVTDKAMKEAKKQKVFKKYVTLCVAESNCCLPNVKRMVDYPFEPCNR